MIAGSGGVVRGEDGCGVRVPKDKGQTEGVKGGQRDMCIVHSL